MSAMRDDPTKVQAPRARLSKAHTVLDPAGAVSGAILGFTLSSGRQVTLGLAPDQLPRLVEAAVHLDGQHRANPTESAPASKPVPIAGWSVRQNGVAAVLLLQLEGGGELAFEVRPPVDNVEGA